MTNILITEFMNEESVKTLKKNFNVKYDKNLFQNEKKIKEEISNFEAIIVRNILGHRFNWQLQSALLAIRQTVQNGGYFRAPDQKFSSLRQTFPRPYFF